MSQYIEFQRPILITSLTTVNSCVLYPFLPSFFFSLQIQMKTCSDLRNFALKVPRGEMLFEALLQPCLTSNNMEIRG